MKKYYCFTILFLLVSQLFSQNYTMSGYLSDKSSGEVLIGATIYNPKTYEGTTTNAYGFYSLTMDSGEVSVVFAYLGFKTVTIDTLLNKNMSLNVSLDEGV